MNQEKAREFFSAYHEGSLETGLQQSLEQKLRTDSDLRREYRDFEHTMEELGGLKFDSIEIPIDLHARITGRMERHIQEQKKATQPAWMSWTRNAAIAGIAAAAIFGAVISFRGAGGPTETAGLIGSGAEIPFEVLSRNGKVVLNYVPSTEKTVVVRDGHNGPEIRRISLNSGDKLDSPLINENPGSALYSVEVLGTAETMLIAVPGSQREPSPSGQGTLQDFAKALAGYYRVPVEVKAKDLGKKVEWNFDMVTSPQEAAVGTLGSTEFSVDQKHTGLICIMDQ